MDLDGVLLEPRVVPDPGLVLDRLLRQLFQVNTVVPCELLDVVMLLADAFPVVTA